MIKEIHINIPKLDLTSAQAQALSEYAANAIKNVFPGAQTVLVSVDDDCEEIGIAVDKEHESIATVVATQVDTVIAEGLYRLAREPDDDVGADALGMLDHLISEGAII